MLTAMLLGLALGIRHAADPDHLAAIAALVARHRRPAAAARIGAVWGVGHSLVIFAVGGTFIVLRITAVPSWARASELAVAVILVALGISNLRSLRGHPIGSSPPRQHDRLDLPASGAEGAARSETGDVAVASGAIAASGVSPQAPEGRAQRAEGERSQILAPEGRAQRAEGERRSSGLASAQQRVLLRPLVIGMTHGLAGSAAVALLALAAMPSPQAALAYLVVFGLGTVGSMVAMSLGLGVPASLAGTRPAFARWVVVGSGALSIGVGIYLALAVGVASNVL